MLNDSFKKGVLPLSLREANISLILKRGKQPEDCCRLISLLNVDLKFLSKILATQLQGFFPLFINDDQTGFIKGRTSHNNMRRLLNTVQYFHQKSLDGMVVSFDAEKASDHIEWSYLFHTFNRFSLGEKFIKCYCIIILFLQFLPVVNYLPTFTFREVLGRAVPSPL